MISSPLNSWSMQATRIVQAIPQRLRIALYATVLVAAGLGFYSWVSRGTATLKLEGRHDLRRPTVLVSIDGESQQLANIEGAKKRFGFLGTTEASFSEALPISAGKHTVQVRVRSIEDGFDEKRQVKITALEDSTSTLAIHAEREGKLSVDYEKPDGEERTGYFSYLFSIFATVGGTVLSTSVAFVVQEFLKSRRLPSRTAVG
jgi:hypothetical protein